MGWTVNMAHPVRAIISILLLMAILLIPVLLLDIKEARTSTVVLVFGAAIAVVCLLCAYLSSRTE
jgi:hypothetical protein